jgi:hypothetical protein
MCPSLQMESTCSRKRPLLQQTTMFFFPVSMSEPPLQ